jgi:hypothetical protein
MNTFDTLYNHITSEGSINTKNDVYTQYVLGSYSAVLSNYGLTRTIIKRVNGNIEWKVMSTKIQPLTCVGISKQDFNSITL